MTDHNSASPTSISRTVIAPVSAAMSTSPKNCSPADGGRFACPASGCFAKRTCGPKVGS